MISVFQPATDEWSYIACAPRTVSQVCVIESAGREESRWQLLAYRVDDLCEFGGIERCLEEN